MRANKRGRDGTTRVDNGAKAERLCRSLGTVRGGAGVRNSVEYELAWVEA